MQAFSNAPAPLSNVSNSAAATAGNLLGNLLGAVVHLLEGPAMFTALGSLLDHINAILGAL